VGILESTEQNKGFTTMLYIEEIKAIAKVKECVAVFDFCLSFSPITADTELSLKVALNAIRLIRDELKEAADNAFEAALMGDRFAEASLKLQNILPQVIDWVIEVISKTPTQKAQNTLINLNQILLDANAVLIGNSKVELPKTEDIDKEFDELKKTFAEPVQQQQHPSYKILVSRCMGDSKQADRLIQHELTKDPSQSRAQATRAAIARWERDRCVSCC
jgi:hypothetical protein